MPLPAVMAQEGNIVRIVVSCEVCFLFVLVEMYGGITRDNIHIFIIEVVISTGRASVNPPRYLFITDRGIGH